MDVTTLGASFAAWCPATPQIGEWIEVSFTEPTLLSSVRIQKPVSTTSTNKWPTALDIQIESVEDYPGVLSDFQVSLFAWFSNYIHK